MNCLVPILYVLLPASVDLDPSLPRGCVMHIMCAVIISYCPYCHMYIGHQVGRWYSDDVIYWFTFDQIKCSLTGRARAFFITWSLIYIFDIIDILPLTLSSISHLPDSLHDHWHIPIYLIHLLSYIKLCMSLYIYDPLSFYPYYPDIHYKMYVSLFIWSYLSHFSL